MSLSQELQTRHAKLLGKFNKYAWQDYADEIIPEDKAYALEIVEFLLDALAAKAPEAFFRRFPMEFSYGPLGDDSNYLDFDETAEDGTGLGEIFIAHTWKPEVARKTA